MTALTFTIPGAPRGKGRPRFGGGRTFTDAKTVAYESLIKHAAHVAMAGRERFAGPVEVSIIVRLEPAASTPKAARAAALAGQIHPVKRPDLDNIIKAVLDGCNTVVFADDAQVCWINAGKTYAATAGVDVTIRPDTARQSKQGIAA